MLLNAPEALPLSHSWPLFEQERHFALGDTFALDFAPGLTLSWIADNPDLTRMGIGWWTCDLADGDALSWTSAVYDIFGLPRGAMLSRPETVALYTEESRAKMERLRAHAIRHKRGFTLDAEIRPAGGGVTGGGITGGVNRMRLIAAPVCEGGKVVRLHGVKRVL